MLGNWRTHKEYQSYLLEKILPFFESDKKKVLHYEDALSKLYILDLDPLKALLADQLQELQLRINLNLSVPLCSCQN